ncbi:MAG TPA: hypothetical protein VN258_16845 [Mobilitalea sp.]|nr:hypothetical protein [Mobilitalea sp.]
MNKKRMIQITVTLGVIILIVILLHLLGSSMITMLKHHIGL